MDIGELKKLLSRYNLKPNFTYGQNFLLDDFALEDIIDAAEITSADNILEIGPGIGNLTELLCRRAGFVLSIEKDPKFLPILKAVKKDHPKNFRFEIADVLEYNFQDFFTNDLAVGANHSYKVVANIPYYITGKILQLFLRAKIKPSGITVLVQKEVAESIVAKPGRLSILAISVQLYGEPKFIRTVSASSFHPTPKVDSAIIQIVPYKKNPYEIPNETIFFKIVKACFAGKRKQIHNTLKNNLDFQPDRIAKILSSLKINPAARPQELTIEQWIRLTDKIDGI